MVSNKDFALLKRYSERGFDFSKSEKVRSSKRVKSVEEGVVTISSGYLAVSDAQNIEAYGQLPFADYQKSGRGRINLNSSSWRVPRIMQGDSFVAFRNLFGDGCFAVLSSNNRFYVETDFPITINQELITRIKEGDFEEKKGSRLYHLEGLVGVGCGTMVVTDPVSNPIEYAKGHEANETSTILSIRPGIYVCRFIEDGKKLAIRKKN